MNQPITRRPVGVGIILAGLNVSLQQAIKIYADKEFILHNLHQNGVISNLIKFGIISSSQFTKCW